MNLKTRCGRPLLSGLQGLFSVGALLGSTLLGLAASSRAPRTTPSVEVQAGVQAVVQAEERGPGAAKPSRLRPSNTLLVLGALTAMAFVSALLQADHRAGPVVTAALAAASLRLALSAAAPLICTAVRPDQLRRPKKAAEA